MADFGAGQPTLVMATANPHKVHEIAAILNDFAIEPRPEGLGDVVEDGETLADNARLKAVAVCEFAQTEHDQAGAAADDTGLEVDALDGAPGVHSSRFAGPDATDADNVAKLLADLAGVADPAGRTARFRTVALVRFPDGRELRADGVVEGTIAFEQHGDGGFGYDPVFIPVEGDGRSFAEMTDEEKNAISHRGRAFRLLAEALAQH